MYRLLAPRDPHEIDRLYLWQIGALLRTDMVGPTAEEEDEARRLLQSKAQRVKEAQARRKNE